MVPSSWPWNFEGQLIIPVVGPLNIREDVRSKGEDGSRPREVSEFGNFLEN